MSTDINARKAGVLERFFKLKEHSTTVGTEVIAGLSTFLTTIYIIAVNPSILSATGMDPKAVFWATALSSAIGCFLIGLLANFPFALAPGMGLNAYFSYYLVGSLGLSWQNALACVFISSVCFVLLSFIGVQQKIVDGMPDCIKHSIGAGIGMFIAFAGLTQSGVIVSNPDTVLALGDLSSPGPLLAVIGVVLCAVLVIRKVKGGILISILAITIAGLFVTDPATGQAFTVWPEGGLVSFDNPITALAPTFGQLSIEGMFSGPPAMILGVVFAVVSFLFADLFNSVAVLLGLSSKAGLLNEKGELPKAGLALQTSAVAAAVGAIFGTQTVTIYGAESTVGISEGGRTGLTAVVIGLLFLVCLIFSPLFLMIPAIATAPALIMVGVFMMEPLAKLALEDVTIAFPVFFAVVMMPFTFNISYGILFSLLGYTLAFVAGGKRKEITTTVWVLTIVFFIYLILDIIL